MRDVIGADGLLGESSRKRGAQRGIAVCFQQRVQAFDFGNPRARSTMDQLGQVLEGRRPQLKEVLPLQISASALAGHRGGAVRAVLGQDRAGPGLELSVMIRTEAAGDNAQAITVEIQRARQADSVWWHRVECPSWITTQVGDTLTGTRKASPVSAILGRRRARAASDSPRSATRATDVLRKIIREDYQPTGAFASVAQRDANECTAESAPHTGPIENTK